MNVLRVLAVVGVLTTVACTTTPELPTGTDQARVRARITHLLPDRLDDRKGWAMDIQQAFESQGIATTDENLCATVAVIGQASEFAVDPDVPGLGAAVRKDIEQRARAKRIPRLAVSTALNQTSDNGRTYGQRLDALKTQGQLSALYEDAVVRAQLGKRLLGDANPVQMAGPMQVSLVAVEAQRANYPYALEGTTLRREAFTRRGGLHLGVAQLLGYATPYTRKIHRFADYSAGWYASRNAAFQQAVAVATGTAIELDGALLLPGATLDRPGETEKAIRLLGSRLGMDEATIRRELSREKTLHFNDSPLYVAVFALADARNGSPLERERLPAGKRTAPGGLSAGEFAARAYGRYQACMTTAATPGNR